MKITLNELRKIVKKELKSVIIEQENHKLNDNFLEKIADLYFKDQLKYTGPEDWLDVKVFNVNYHGRDDEYVSATIKQGRNEFNFSSEESLPIIHAPEDIRNEEDVIEEILKLGMGLGIKRENINLKIVQDKIDEKFMEYLAKEIENGEYDSPELKTYKKELGDWEYRDFRSGSDPHYTGRRPKHPNIDDRDDW